MAYTRSVAFRRDLDRSWTLNGSTTYAPLSFVQTDTKSGSRVQKYKELIKRAQSAGSAYSRTAWRYEAKPSSVGIKSYFAYDFATKRDLNMNGVLNPGVLVVDAGASPNEARALSRFYDSIRAKQEGMNGLLVLGEIRETIKMLRKPGMGLIELFGDYAGASKGLRQKHSAAKSGLNPKRFEKAASDLWLEYSFGWKPLISDVQDAATTVARIAYDNALRTDRARGSHEDSKSILTAGEGIETMGVPSPAPRTSWSQEQTTQASIRYVGGVAGCTNGPVEGFTALSKITGFTLDNFVPTVWNLLPYSFLVDYFVNIGDCIDACFTDTSSVRWWSRTYRRVDQTHLNTSFDERSTRTAWAAANWVVQSMTSSNGYVIAVRTVLDRTVGTVVPVPPVTFSMPAVDSSKYWNMLALWRGKAGGTYDPRGKYA